jgi:hypothetical protein
MNGEEGEKEAQEENIRQISQNITNKFGNHRLRPLYEIVHFLTPKYASMILFSRVNRRLFQTNAKYL